MIMQKRSVEWIILCSFPQNRLLMLHVLISRWTPALNETVQHTHTESRGDRITLADIHRAHFFLFLLVDYERHFFHCSSLVRSHTLFYYARFFKKKTSTFTHNLSTIYYFDKSEENISGEQLPSTLRSSEQLIRSKEDQPWHIISIRKAIECQDKQHKFTFLTIFSR